MPKRIWQPNALDECDQTSWVPPKQAWDSMRCIAGSEPDHGADRLSRMHELERFVDALQRQLVGDEGIQRDLAAHRLRDHARQLRAPLDAAERRAAPDAPGHQLERPRADLLPGAGDTDDHRLAPTLVAALQRRAHHLDVADALEAEV